VIGCTRRASGGGQGLPADVDCSSSFEMKFEFQMSSNRSRIWINQMKAFPNLKK
jgi:hypothetical protein